MGPITRKKAHSQYKTGKIVLAAVYEIIKFPQKVSIILFTVGQKTSLVNSTNWHLVGRLAKIGYN